MIGHGCIVVLFGLMCSLFVLSEGVSVRLVGGGSSYEGRVEVENNGQWGTVCNDNFDDNACHVVCSQLEYRGGTFIKDATYGTSTLNILLDDVKCNGDEAHIGQCIHSNWGDHNCDHTEDSSCRCDPPIATGQCDRLRHQITPFDPTLQGVGRAEVKNSLGEWQLICDDYWDDQDAHVFCDCLGYTEKEHFRAYWSSKLINMAPTRTVGYDAIHCGVGDMTSTRNIWECGTQAAKGLCNGKTEAAGIACQKIPVAIPPPAPVTNLSCDGRSMTLCFSSTYYTINKQYLNLDPACPSAVTRDTPEGACYDIVMNDCNPKKASTDPSHKHYCYDISYSQYDGDPVNLQMDTVWSHRACCSVAKNRTVHYSFQPRNVDVPTASVVAAIPFALKVYTDERFSSQLEGAMTVIRGQELFVKVVASAHDSQLQLVVPTCHFKASNETTSPSYTFVANKCPLAPELDMSYYAFGAHSWGFKFKVPKFVGYNELYLTCDAYVCDPVLDGKPYCDRSCEKSSARRRRRSLPTHPDGQVMQGPFHIKDQGTGPLITVGAGNVATLSHRHQDRWNGVKQVHPYVGMHHPNYRQNGFYHGVSHKDNSGLKTAPRSSLVESAINKLCHGASSGVREAATQLELMSVFFCTVMVLVIVQLYFMMD